MICKIWGVIGGWENDERRDYGDMCFVGGPDSQGPRPCRWKDIVETHSPLGIAEGNR